MNWKMKCFAAATLSRIPFGTRVYHRLQKKCGTNKFNFEESLQRAKELLDLVRTAGVGPEGMVCVEVGTGWRPFVPFFFKLAGAERIITYDVNPWLDRFYAWETISHMRDRIGEVATALQTTTEELEDRFPCIEEGDSLSEMLTKFDVDYQCPGDAAKTGLPSGMVDAVVSSNVLEHIPRKILSDIHKESRRILKPGGAIAHRFNPGDHFAHSDRRITAANFLKFSSAQWYWIGGSGLAFHNRLRCYEHYEQIIACGFEVKEHRVRRNHRAEEAIEQGVLVLHNDFTSRSPEDLCADYMWISACEQNSSKMETFHTRSAELRIGE